MEVLEITLQKNAPNKKTIIYISPVDWLGFEGLMNSVCFTSEEGRDRIKMYRQFVPTALQALGLESNTKVSWQSKAGCSCGCSPGFVVAADYGRTIWLDVGNPPLPSNVIPFPKLRFLSQTSKYQLTSN